MLARLQLTQLTSAGFLNEWIALAELVDSLTQVVKIAVVGKYTDLSDAYLSVSKALQHASFAAERKLKIVWIEAADLADETMTSEPAAHAEAWAKLKGADGILVPGGFGDRGVEGKIAAVRYARESKVPFFGICLGFQVPLLLTLREPPHSHPAFPRSHTPRPPPSASRSR